MAISEPKNTPMADTLVPEAANLLRTIDGRLYLLGWQRSHPRVTAFIEKVQQKHTSLNLLGLEQVPIKYLKLLSEFLKIYSQCDQLIKILNLNWQSATIAELTADYGGIEQMPILGWKHLYECLEHQYFMAETDLTKPIESKAKKERKKRSPIKSKS